METEQGLPRLLKRLVVINLPRRLVHLLDANKYHIDGRNVTELYTLFHTSKENYDFIHPGKNCAKLTTTAESEIWYKSEDPIMLHYLKLLDLRYVIVVFSNNESFISKLDLDLCNPKEVFVDLIGGCNGISIFNLELLNWFEDYLTYERAALNLRRYGGLSSTTDNKKIVERDCTIYWQTVYDITCNVTYKHIYLGQMF